MKISETQEGKRLVETQQQTMPWRRWGPYLSERQWGTVREDYSADGNAWDYFPHNDARSRTFRWGEDGIAGISDNMQRLCFALALWNGEDDILKDRMFGLTNSQGNHGEDVKEYYFYLDNTPTHSYMKYLYRYLGDDFTVECPTGSGKQMTLWEIAMELSQRLIGIFLRDSSGRRPVYGGTQVFQENPNWRDLILFYEYFQGENGAGLGASHQTGWTGLVAKLIRQWADYAGQDHTAADNEAD